MKKKSIIIFLVLITFQSFSQMSNASMKSSAIEYLVKSIIKFKGQEVVPFNLKFLDKSLLETKEINLFYYSVEKLNAQGVIFCFQNKAWSKETPFLFNRYIFYDLTLKRAQQLLNKIINIEKSWKKNQWDKSLSMKFDDLTIVIHERKSKMNSKLTVYFQDFDSEWSHHRIRKTKENLNKFIAQ